MLAVLLIAAGPSLSGVAPTRIPQGWWIALFCAMVLALLGAVWDAPPERLPWQRAAFGLGVLTSWALVITGMGIGLLPVVLVVVVSVGPYLAPTWVGFTLTALNLVVIAASFGPRAWSAAWMTEVSIMLGFYLLIQVAALLSSLALLREQRSRRELAEAHVELQAQAELLAESARSGERLRISRDLHDLIGHQLAVLTLELEAAKHRDPGSAAAPHIERAGHVARELLSDVRTTVGELRGARSDLRGTLQRVVQDLTRPSVALEVDDGLEPDEERTVLLIRAVQEIVTNTIRHADARELRIEVRAEGEGIVLRARDDGRGARELRPGNGLRGLRERFESLGGDVAFDGSRGFGVTAKVPTA
ncbi:two-component sensor histidine kinase [Leucobacter sp. wl10]|nr:two-component sensor histidine kinase [Leucobacter sp. wl10]